MSDNEATPADVMSESLSDLPKDLADAYFETAAAIGIYDELSDQIKGASSQLVDPQVEARVGEAMMRVAHSLDVLEHALRAHTKSPEDEQELVSHPAFGIYQTAMEYTRSFCFSNHFVRVTQVQGITAPYAHLLRESLLMMQRAQQRAAQAAGGAIKNSRG